jgi:hypothetical protein
MSPINTFPGPPATAIGEPRALLNSDCWVCVDDVFPEFEAAFSKLHETTNETKNAANVVTTDFKTVPPFRV